MPKKKSSPELVMHGFFYRDGTPVRFPATKRKSLKRDPLLRADAINDFRVGIDRVVRYDGACWIVPGDGPFSYEPVQVRSDELTEEGKRQLAALPPAALANMIDAIYRFAFLSDEGRRERLAFINTLPRFTVIETFSFPASPETEGRRPSEQFSLPRKERRDL